MSSVIYKNNIVANNFLDQNTCVAPINTKGINNGELTTEEVEKKIDAIVSRSKICNEVIDIDDRSYQSINDHIFCLRSFLKSISNLSNRSAISLINIYNITWKDQGSEGITACIKVMKEDGKRKIFFFKTLDYDKDSAFIGHDKSNELRFNSAYMAVCSVPETLVFSFINDYKRNIKCVFSEFAQPKQDIKYNPYKYGDNLGNILKHEERLLGLFNGIVIKDVITKRDHNTFSYEFNNNLKIFVIDNLVGDSIKQLFKNHDNMTQSDVERALSQLRVKIKNYNPKNSEGVSIANKTIAKSIILSQYALKKGVLQDNLSKELVRIFQEEYANRKGIDPSDNQAILNAANGDWDYKAKIDDWASNANIEQLKSALEERPSDNQKRPYADRTISSTFDDEILNVILSSPNVVNEEEMLHYTAFNEEIAKYLRDAAIERLAEI